ncbi:tyrosine-type recombinase/integrase [Desulfomonile tiedjei]|uniref:Site-specific recombinase XerD n=1 Tax=Desulfomonile tiedjei (strain ATCC 49306 / DSM 6799 / DCB-1) TaxID=706587 RepID=I4C966_DESTA|nr:tyrosine-type recombinase/integrase [Desulfomonile tiedjei]AFM26107.1 site-specific recombinase XerD [Desulfomonile tiedjei DSM 6799]
MAIKNENGRFVIYFQWKKERLETVSEAKNLAEAKRIEKDVKSAFRVYRFDSLDEAAKAWVIRTHENKGWALPSELARPLPGEDLTLMQAITAYLEADTRHRSERNLSAIDRLVEHFTDNPRLKDIRVPQVREYRRARQEKVENGTVNRELSVLSGVMRLQVELENLDFNPCTMIKRLPENQRDTYLSWKDFSRLLEHSGWIRDVLEMMYYTGMRFGEVVNLRWEMYKPERRMLVLPPDVTKEGKSERKVRLRPKRVPLRKEPLELLETLRRGDDGKVVRAIGLIFAYGGRYKKHRGPQSDPIDRFMVRKAWDNAIKATGLKGLQRRDLRHTWKTNAQRSGMDPAVRNLIVGHSGERSVQDRYIRVSDQVLLDAVDSMTFDHGWTELDIAEKAHPDSLPKKVTGKSRENSEERKKAVG